MLIMAMSRSQGSSVSGRRVAKSKVELGRLQGLV